MAEEDEDINQNFITWPFDLKVLKQNIDSEILESFVNNIDISELIVDVGWAISLGFERDQRQPASIFYVRVLVIDWVLGLEYVIHLPFLPIYKIYANVILWLVAL